MATPRTRSIVIRLTLAVLIVALGLAVRAVLDGPLAKYGGGALYAALVYVLLSALRPAARPHAVFVAALAVCVAIELFQLTPIPARLAEVHGAFALVLGTTFHGPDLVAYSVGGALAFATHRAIHTRGS